MLHMWRLSSFVRLTPRNHPTDSDLSLSTLCYLFDLVRINIRTYRWTTRTHLGIPSLDLPSGLLRTWPWILGRLGWRNKLLCMMTWCFDSCTISYYTSIVHILLRMRWSHKEFLCSHTCLQGIGHLGDIHLVCGSHRDLLGDTHLVDWVYQWSICATVWNPLGAWWFRDILSL